MEYSRLGLLHPAHSLSEGWTAHLHSASQPIYLLLHGPTGHLTRVSRLKATCDECSLTLSNEQRYRPRPRRAAPDCFPFRHRPQTTPLKKGGSMDLCTAPVPNRTHRHRPHWQTMSFKKVLQGTGTSPICVQLFCIDRQLDVADFISEVCTTPGPYITVSGRKESHRPQATQGFCRQEVSTATDFILKSLSRPLSPQQSQATAARRL